MSRKNYKPHSDSDIPIKTNETITGNISENKNTTIIWVCTSTNAYLIKTKKTHNISKQKLFQQHEKHQQTKLKFGKIYFI
jgi:hypothetical protein